MMAEFVTKMAFMVEILAAELMFVYPAERRSRFPLRCAAALAVCALYALFNPIGYTSILAQLMLFITMFAVSILAVGFCFRLKISALISSCVAGYAVEHIAFHITKIAMHFGFMAGVQLWDLQQRVICEAVLFPIIYALFWLTVGLYAAKNECYKSVNMRFNYLSFAIVFICIGLTRVAAFFGDQESVTVSIYAITACLMALVVQLVLSRAEQLRHEYETVNLLWQEDRRQYEISKKTIDTINIKYHDLKHKLRGMNLPQEEVDSIKDAVRVYGSRIATGNEALDVLLTENSLRCGEEGITLSYMGNGADLGFMNVMDVYSLFGNAVDNAIEAVRKLEDPEKRVIDVVSERMGDMISVNITNYFTGSLSFEDGLPRTSKTGEVGFHGFGMKSMKLICEKYGGSLKAAARGDVFTLSMYLMEK